LVSASPEFAVTLGVHDQIVAQLFHAGAQGL